jgi:hypothetical protein
MVASLKIASVVRGAVQPEVRATLLSQKTGPDRFFYLTLVFHYSFHTISSLLLLSLPTSLLSVYFFLPFSPFIYIHLSLSSSSALPYRERGGIQWMTSTVTKTAPLPLPCSLTPETRMLSPERWASSISCHLITLSPARQKLFHSYSIHSYSILSLSPIIFLSLSLFVLFSSLPPPLPC